MVVRYETRESHRITKWMVACEEEPYRLHHPARWVRVSGTEPRPGSMRGIYTLKETINTLGISLGT